MIDEGFDLIAAVAAAEREKARARRRAEIGRALNQLTDLLFRPWK